MHGFPLVCTYCCGIVCAVYYDHLSDDPGKKSTVHMETPTVRQMFSALIHNDQAMTVVITIVLINCSLYITSNLLLYFLQV